MNTNENSENRIDPMIIQSMLESFNLDWYVKKEPLTIYRQIPDEDAYPEPEMTPFFATVRQDTRECFAAVKAGYEVFQNHELAELVHRVAGSMGHEVTNGGSFNGGGQVYLQIRLENQKVSNDTIQRWASGINSFDGSTALRWSPETNTISCQNTFWAAYKQMKNSVKHTTNMRMMVERSLKAIEALNEADHNLFEIFNRFVNEAANADHIAGVVQKVTGVDLKVDQKVEEEKHSTRTLNKAEDLLESITGEINSKGRTLWGLWSGLTHYSTWKAGNEKNREKSKALGSLNRMDNAVFELMRTFVYA